MIERRDFLKRRPGATAVLSLVLLCVLGCGTTHAEDAQPDDAPPASFTAISPIFGQLVAFSQPSNFVPVFEQPNEGRYIREAVPKGESAEQWSEMITITGAKGLAANPQLSPEAFVGLIAAGFKKACPDTYAEKVIGDAEIEGGVSFAAVASCGTVASGDEQHSETALIIAIKGESDYYTLQWAERAEASDETEIDLEAWKEHLEALRPIRLCPIVPGEKAPYASCVGHE